MEKLIDVKKVVDSFLVSKKDGLSTLAGIIGSTYLFMEDYMKGKPFNIENLGYGLLMLFVTYLIGKKK